MLADLDVDYLVIGAGAAGMAFTDALIAHADATVALVDTRDAPGGHWHDAYPFVQLHQASPYYGVASTVLGGELQTTGPESGLHERATGAQVLEYYAAVMTDVFEPTGRVQFLGRRRHEGGGLITELATGRQHRARPGTRIVDARYLSPTVPQTTPPPWAVGNGSHVIPSSKLDPDTTGRLVIVGSGKTATDAIVHLLTHGTDPGDITWIRPRDPWMLDRALVQPKSAAFHEMGAAVLESAAQASSLDDLFARMEAAGVMMRIDPSVTPTMAKAPTLGRWELDLLRSVENIVRAGRIVESRPGLLRLQHGDVQIPRDATIIHCAADGLRRPAPQPIWSTEAITLQTVRAGFPCFGAALTGYVEATRTDDATKNALCPPNLYGDTRADWVAMTVRGARAVTRFMAEPDIAAWANGTTLNPARVTDAADPATASALERSAEAAPAGLEALERLAALT
ncbi:NAD(P)-binding protein [uncultured Demequina sp.]|uniref:NAD(P)-binding protein n=1 Tax=uncultured Demequina sp. TaxID=693499 RepID=UPI0025CB7F0A|nr:FAD/NAD(P)-binding protein [uncultured Demequina sp.]